MEPGAKSKAHKHVNFEEFIILDGELIDYDNNVFKKGDIVTYEPGSKHSSYTKKGCFILVLSFFINKGSDLPILVMRQIFSLSGLIIPIL